MYRSKSTTNGEVFGIRMIYCSQNLELIVLPKTIEYPRHVTRIVLGKNATLNMAAQSQEALPSE